MTAKEICSHRLTIVTGHYGTGKTEFSVNLALALQNYGVDVDFATVWGQGHVEAERTGNSTDNFIAWVNQCLQ